MSGVAAVAAWTSPALVVAVVARVMAGGVEAPLFVLAMVAAPLLALLAGAASRATRSGFALTTGLVTGVCVLGAGFRAVTDLGHVLGLETGATLGSAAALVLATTVWPDHHRVAATATVLGALALLSAVAMLAAATGAAPWTAWGRVASRSAFELGPRSEWTRDGAQFLAPITLTFGAPQRITAVTPAVVRVTEADRRIVTRERTLAAGEALTVRPGDTLALPAGARFRFEAGHRVPGAPESGVRWADGLEANRLRLVTGWIGLTVTLAGGALMLVRPDPATSRAAAVLGPVLALGVVLAATCWGVYAVDLAPELSIGAVPAALLARLAPIVVDEPWRSRLLTAVVLALLALFVGCAAALRRGHADMTASRGTENGSGPADATAAAAASRRHRVLEPMTWIGLVAAAAAASVVTTDGFTLLLHGAGLAAAVVLGPLLAAGQAHDGARARARGAVAGALIFVGAAALAWWPAAGGALETLARYPALAAVPGSWLVTIVSRPPRSRRRW